MTRGGRHLPPPDPLFRRPDLQIAKAIACYTGRLGPLGPTRQNESDMSPAPLDLGLVLPFGPTWPKCPL